MSQTLTRIDPVDLERSNWSLRFFRNSTIQVSSFDEYRKINRWKVIRWYLGKDDSPRILIDVDCAKIPWLVSLDKAKHGYRILPDELRIERHGTPRILARYKLIVRDIINRGCVQGAPLRESIDRRLQGDSVKSSIVQSNRKTRLFG